MAWTTVLLVALLSAAAHAAPPRRGPGLEVVADRPVDAVYLRRSPPGGGPAGPWERVGDHVPLVLSVDGSMEYDVRVEARAGIFRDWRGTQTRLQAGCTVQVPTQLEPAWGRMAATGGSLVSVLVLALAVRLRRVRRGTAALEHALIEAEARADLGLQQMPRRIGPYRVVARLGTGGQASVYRAENAYGDPYALKVPLPVVLEDPAWRERFLRETAIGTLLRHPAIVRVHDVHPGDAATPAYIALELVDGGTLKELLAREGPLPIHRALQIGRAVADALAHAHERGVIHRDIKPSNVMLTGGGEVRVTDFGIARLTTVTALTGTDTTLGTPQYMAPEQVHTRLATPRVDLYSLGVLLFEMLSARLPIEDEEPFALVSRKMRERATPITVYRPDVGPRLERLLALLLHRDPEKRPSTAAEVARLLAALERAEAAKAGGKRPS